VGIVIYVSDAVRAKGLTGRDVGEPIKDSLAVRKLTSEYFCQNAVPGAPTSVSAIVGSRVLTAKDGRPYFTPRTINFELDAIQKMTDIPYVRTSRRYR
jgi:hypothetical protein